MKKINIITIISIIIGALVISGSVLFYILQIYPVLRDMSNENHLYDTLIFIFLLVTGILILVLSVIFYLTNKRKRDKYLAYWNADLNVYNENNFVRFTSKRIKKHINNSAVLSFSIIGNKVISAQFGYNTSEMILQSIAQVLIDMFPPEEAVYAYTTNSSFLLYITFTRSSECREIADKIEKKVNEYVYNSGLNLNLKLAFGITFVDDQNASVEDYIKKSNIARSMIRNENSDTIMFFDDSFLDSNISDLEMSGEIERALKNEEFEVYYQPKYDIKLKRFIGAEALIRWNHQTKGIIRPGSFIPYAERNGQIKEIDRYVFEHVCRDIEEWKKKGQRLLVISINVSRVDLYQSDLFTFFEETIQKYKVNPLLIEIELTESIATKNVLFVTSIMKKIRALKFKVSIDDFGTGYSSLSILKDIPIDTLKLDKSFFDDVEIDAKARDIVRFVIELAKALNLYIVAEGLHTAKQIQFIKTTKCDAVQGYFYSEPLPKEEYVEFLKKNSHE